VLGEGEQKGFLTGIFEEKKKKQKQNFIFFPF